MKTKIKPANLSKVNFALLRKETVRVSTEMKAKEIPGGDAPDNTIPFLVRKKHTFSCKTEHPLFILGAKNPAWKKQAKIAFKEDKKGVLYGNCYIMDDILFLQVQKGNMKITEMKKLLKILLKRAGITNVSICQGVKNDKKDTDSSTNDQTTVSNDQATNSTTDNTDKATDNTADNSAKDEAKTNPKDTINKMKDLIKGIGASIKETVKGEIIPNIKQKKVSAKDLELTEELLGRINELKGLYDNAEIKVKDALQKHYDRVIAFLPNIEKIKAAINKLTPSATADDVTKEDKKETKVNRKNSIQGLKDLLGEVNDMLKKLGA